MKTAMMLLAGVMFTSVAIAAANNQYPEEFYQAKYGRHTSQYETRIKADRPPAATSVRPSLSCCRRQNASTVVALVKKGRPRPAAGEDSVRCEQGCCQ